jgi:hypothetical protein
MNSIVAAPVSHHDVDIPADQKIAMEAHVRTCERRELVVPLDWVRSRDLGHEGPERYNRTLAAAIDRERRNGWYPVGPTDFAGLARLGRCSLRRAASAFDPLLSGCYLRTALVPLERRVPRPSDLPGLPLTVVGAEDG